MTGGYVYRGSRLKDLVGAYVYGDYDTGKIWALRYDGQKVLWHKEIAETNHRLVGFGEDNARRALHCGPHGGERPSACSLSPVGGLSEFPA